MHPLLDKTFIHEHPYGNDEAIIIPVPQQHHAAYPPKIRGFNDIARSNAPGIVGEIPDMEKFSQSLGWPKDAPKKEFFVKAPGSPFIIPHEFIQFLPTLKKMIDHYYDTNGQDCFCILGIVQATIQPATDTLEPFHGIHKDLRLSRLHRGEEIGQCSVQIACDALTTGFSNYELSLSDIHRISTATDPDATMLEILKDSGLKLDSFAPGIITEHDVTTIHALGNPETPTRRTALIANFTQDSDRAKAFHHSPCLDPNFLVHNANTFSKYENRL